MCPQTNEVGAVADQRRGTAMFRLVRQSAAAVTREKRGIVCADGFTLKMTNRRPLTKGLLIVGIPSPSIIKTSSCLVTLRQSGTRGTRCDQDMDNTWITMVRLGTRSWASDFSVSTIHSRGAWGSSRQRSFHPEQKCIFWWLTNQCFLFVFFEKRTKTAKFIHGAP